MSQILNGKSVFEKRVWIRCATGPFQLDQFAIGLLVQTGTSYIHNEGCKGSAEIILLLELMIEKYDSICWRTLNLKVLLFQLHTESATVHWLYSMNQVIGLLFKQATQSFQNFLKQLRRRKLSKLLVFFGESMSWHPARNAECQSVAFPWMARRKVRLG